MWGLDEKAQRPLSKVDTQRVQVLWKYSELKNVQEKISFFFFKKKKKKEIYTDENKISEMKLLLFTTFHHSWVLG